MKAWRKIYYGIAATAVVAFSLSNHFFMESSVHQDQEVLRQLELLRMMIQPEVLLHEQENNKNKDDEENQYPIAIVAPWTQSPPMNKQAKMRPAGAAMEGDSSNSFATRSFVFADMYKLRSDYGSSSTTFDREEEQHVKQQLLHRLCLRNDKQQSPFFSPKQHYSTRWKCNTKLQILKCVTCTERDGTWYTAVSATGAVFGQVQYQGRSRNPLYLNRFPINETTTMNFPNYNDGPFRYEQLDIAVPIAGQDDKLQKFAARLATPLGHFRGGLYGAKIAVRLLITRFSFDNPSPNQTHELEEFRQKLTVLAGFSRLVDEVVFVPVTNVPTNEFSRAKAVNALHAVAHHDDATALAVIDVDLRIRPEFLRNALTFPFPQSSAYFPIMWSEFDPQSVQLVDEFFPRMKKFKYSTHHGQWRKFSFGMYVIAGSDAPRLAMDESFIGWGGEDNDFFAKVQDKLHIIRLHETGLTHVWHPKHCNRGGFVKDKYLRECIASMSHFEGSQLGMYLKFLQEQNVTEFAEIMEAAKQVEAKDAADETSTEELSLAESAALDEDGSTVLVGVISSRKAFSTRVKSIMKTWGESQNVPEGTLLRFFVGMPDEGSEYVGKPVEDVADLAAQAGITDLSSIVVMDGVVDDEYPPVRKNTAMIATLNSIVETFENDTEAPSTFQWIYKVDDDAYVNFDAMLSFLRTRSYERHSVYGEQGHGRMEDRDGLRAAGLVKPYCTGGPGYIMARRTVQDTAPRLSECVRLADASEYRDYLWHSDSVIGLCIYNATGAGCWDDKDYRKHRIFRHNLRKVAVFPESSELSRTIASHPFKDEESMMKQHMRYVEITATS